MSDTALSRETTPTRLPLIHWQKPRRPSWRHDRPFLFRLFVLYPVAFLLIVAAALSGCTVSPGASTNALDAYGFTDVQLGGPAPWSCSERDAFSRSFTARNQRGRLVRGVVCTGIFKGATVRITGAA